MLNITPQRSSEGAKSYFAKSDYYSEGQELVGNWGGKGSVLLGLFGEVDKGAFENLCDNLDPKTKRPLTPVTRGDRRVGYDFTWSAPKSVSVVHALTGDERIAKAFRASIDDTMAEMEADMQTRVRKSKAQQDRTTGNLLWAEFVHLTSRPVNGMPCPQLHSHVFAFNATFDPVESKWKAGQFGKIKGDGYYWQAVQQARFANRLQALGYSIRKTKDAFEIEGVPDPVLKKFSLRTGVIEAAAEKLGITDPKAKAKLAATTREAKLSSIPYPTLVKTWDGVLTPAERASLNSVKGKPKPGINANSVHALYAAEHSFERASVVDERRLLALALRHGIGEVTPEGVRAEADRLGLLKREEAGKVFVTTKDVLEEERRLIGFASQSKGTCRPVVGSEAIVFDDDALDREQRAAVQLPLRSADRITIIRGIAGTGKTRAVTEAVKQISLRGRSVVLVAPTSRAVDVLREGGFKDADTLARFLIDPKMQERARDGFILLDEAGMVGSKSMNAVFDLSKELNARIVLLGDKRQLSSVDRGSPLRVLEDLAGLQVAEITNIRRQTGEYREAVKLISAGKTGDGLRKLDAMGCVKLMPVWDSYEPIARDYAQKISHAGAAEREKEALIVCPTHAEGEKVTAAVRTELKERGLIGGQDQTFERLVPLQWTAAERGDASRYAGDEVLQFHRNCGDFRAGERVEASTVREKLDGIRAGNFAAFGRATIGLAKGDLIRATAKGKTRDGKHALSNGNIYCVDRFDRNGDIVLSNGWIIGKDFGQPIVTRVRFTPISGADAPSGVAPTA